MKTKTISTRVPEDVHSDMKKVAKIEGRTLEGAITTALREFLATRPALRPTRTK